MLTVHSLQTEMGYPLALRQPAAASGDKGQRYRLTVDVSLSDTGQNVPQRLVFCPIPVDLFYIKTISYVRGHSVPRVGGVGGIRTSGGSTKLPRGIGRRMKTM